MNLNEAKQAAYSAANRAAAKVKTMMPAQPPVTWQDAMELIEMAEKLKGAAVEILDKVQMSMTEKQ